MTNKRLKPIPKSLTASEELFAQKMIVATSAIEAYRATHSCVQFTGKQVAIKASALVKRKDVAARVRHLRDLAARDALIDGSDVIKEWMRIAMSDVNSLVEYQRVCCRHCYGINNKYQWEDEEFSKAYAKAIDAGGELPDKAGGVGFQFNLSPHHACPKCFGEGIERVYNKDSRFLSDSARSLYNGVRRTKFGNEILTRDKDAALLNLAKYFKLIDHRDTDDKNANVTIKIEGGFEL